MKLLLIDNYDSFTYNIYYYLYELGIKPQVCKNDFAKSLQEVRDFVDSFDYIVISPGFGSPKDSGLSIPIIQAFAPHKKILGVCLGHQCIATAFGGKVEKMPTPMHAKSTSCFFTPNALCNGISSPFQVALYHSLFVSELGKCQELGFAHIKGLKIPMILKHKHYQTYGVQFHPESILGHNGKMILKNFLAL